ncbi:carbonic anhydrase family protein [Weeksellaceae bacterium TAE3-ERU29]|nr:carbonic anhydrase family protein [Weeksellaceae bacterium TAE3-ERU29]
MIKINYFFIYLFVLINFISCDKSTKENKNHLNLDNVVTAQSDVDSLKIQEYNQWSYAGETSPEHWSELGENDCDGNRQSPINIPTTETVKDSVELLNINNFHYSPKTKINSVVNNGHSILYNFNEGDYLEYNGNKYKLAQFHFHAPAEHLVDGVRYPLEIHMVHITPEKKILVLSFMAKEGAESEAFKELESFLPLKKKQEKVADFSYDFSDHINKDFKYYHYVGSLTTPPCTEGVDWFIMQEPIILSEKQVNLMEQSMPHDNYRPVQPLNGRIVTSN